MDLASGPTFSRLENAVSAKDVYRLAQAFVDQFIASYPEAPEVIVIDMDHSEDPTHGQQEFSFYSHDYQHHCYLPLLLFEGLSGKFITAALRPGKRPTGAENAMILKRVLQRLRAAWPETHIVLRGDGHFANPELMALALADGHTDFIFGLTGNRVLSPLAKPFLETNRRRHAVREANACRLNQPRPTSTRSYHELAYAARSWPQAFRVILKAEVMACDDNPRFVVTSLDLPSPESLYHDLYSARGQDEIYQPCCLRKTINVDCRRWRWTRHRGLSPSAAVPGVAHADARAQRRRPRSATAVGRRVGLGEPAASPCAAS